MPRFRNTRSGCTFPQSRSVCVSQGKPAQKLSHQVIYSYSSQYLAFVCIVDLRAHLPKECSFGLHDAAPPGQTRRLWRQRKAQRAHEGSQAHAVHGGVLLGEWTWGQPHLEGRANEWDSAGQSGNLSVSQSEAVPSSQEAFEGDGSFPSWGRECNVLPRVVRRDVYASSSQAL